MSLIKVERHLREYNILYVISLSAISILFMHSDYAQFAVLFFGLLFMAITHAVVLINKRNKGL